MYRAFETYFKILYSIGFVYKLQGKFIYYILYKDLLLLREIFDGKSESIRPKECAPIDENFS